MSKGISNETKTVTLKKFKPNAKLNDGLNVGCLVDVVVSTAEIKDDSPMDSFRGMSIPRLSFIFESRMDAPGVKKSTYIHSYLPLEHTPESLQTGEGGTAWRWDQMSQFIKHLLDVYRDNKPLTEEEEKALTVDFIDEQDGLFIEQPADVVVAAYKKFFDNIALLFKPADKAIWLNADGKEKIIWIKLLMSIKGKLINNGEFGIPGYIGEGVVELYIKGVPPNIGIKFGKGESIEAAPAVAAAPAPGSGGGVTVNVATSDIPDFMRK